MEAKRWEIRKPVNTYKLQERKKTRQLRSFLSWEPCREFAYFNICAGRYGVAQHNEPCGARNNAETLVGEPAVRLPPFRRILRTDKHKNGERH